MRRGRNCISSAHPCEIGPIVLMFVCCFWNVENFKIQTNNNIHIYILMYLSRMVWVQQLFAQQHHITVHQYLFVEAAPTSRLICTLCSRLLAFSFFGNLPRNSTVVAHSEISTSSIWLTAALALNLIDTQCFWYGLPAGDHNQQLHKTDKCIGSEVHLYSSTIG